MKAEEVLKRYASGERNFCRINIQGQSFKSQNLSEADFSHADIRGVDFTNANLKGTNFSHAMAGLRYYWAAGLLICSLLLSALTGVIATITWLFVATNLTPDNIKTFTIFPSSIVLAMLGVFFIATSRQRFTTGSERGIKAVVVAALSLSVSVLGVVAGAAVGAMAVALVGAGLGAVAAAGAVAGALALAWGEFIVISVAIAIHVAGFFAGGATAAMSVVGALVGIVFIALAGAKANVGIIAVAIVGAIATAFGGTYVGWLALAEDERFALTRLVVIILATTGGTSFRGADLTDSDFTSATLKSTDFRRATLTRTCWQNTQKLDRVRPGSTYLQNSQVRQLVITRDGQGKNFDRQQDLRGVNLQGANLADASFIGADLSETSLQDANLCRAKLVQTQLDQANLTGACLTGACIEDWGITSETKLDGVKCKYVFMRWVKPGDPDQNPRRKPDNWKEEFEDGDFADFIKPIVDTLDLYHNQGIDPRAIAISFKQLAENHPDAQLEIVAMEKRGKDKFRLRAATAPNANHSELSAEYFSTYNQLKALTNHELQALMAEKDSRIHNLEIMVMTALERPSFYTQTYQHYGDMSERKIEINQSGASIGVGYSENFKADQVSGTVNNYAPEQKQTLAEAAAEIQQLLKQLQTQGYSPEAALQKAASNLATQAKSDRNAKNKLIKWGQYLGDAATNGLIGEVAVEVIKLALRLAGIPVP